MASRRIEDIEPQFRDRFIAWWKACDLSGLDLIITCTYRSRKEQDELYARGRTVPGKKVTNASAGHSAHNYGLALDFVPIVNGKPAWAESEPAWRKAGNLAKTYSLEWAGTWEGTMREMAHVQIPGWKSLIQ